MNKLKVKELRLENNLTQEALAEKSFLNVRTIQRMESGNEVNLSSLNSVANVFGVSVNSLFNYVDDEDQDLKIMEFSKKQMKQISKKSTVANCMLISIFAFDFLILSILGIWVNKQNGSFQDIYGTLWVFLFFIVTAISVYLYRISFMNYLDKKYPLASGNFHKNSFKKREPINNGWEFIARYWWLIFPIGGFIQAFIHGFH
ncbi:helix-turn-helix domain-containing protein [Fructilactobacillus vespulae]|uniref:helix-turn-helix domain-containing protein n=1 Tax=Fructilactobacillus vespulae TaxID=1249630 RepID=UPI0039B36676